ncbi:MAG: sulfatase, partial [Pseudomonadota bacterium]
DWTGAAGPLLPGQSLPGQSLLALLGTDDAPDRDRIFASHEFHEINQYYPMRAIRTRTHSYIANLAHPLDYPIAGDVAGSPSWRAIIANPATRLGRRTQAAYRKRPAEELYDLRSDPDEVVNLVDLPAARKTLDQLRQRLTEWRRATRDPWLGEASPYGHAAG